MRTVDVFAIGVGGLLIVLGVGPYDEVIAVAGAILAASGVIGDAIMQRGRSDGARVEE